MKKIKEKFKKLVKDWRFYAWITGFIIAMFVIILNFPTLVMLFGRPVAMLFGLAEKPIEFWLGFGIATLIMIAVAIILVFVFPIFLFILGKLRCYISFITLCFRKRYKIRLMRIPFASLFGIKKTEDVCITAGGINYRIHFIDIPFCLKRRLVIINENAYCITKEVPDSIANLGYGYFDHGTFMSRYINVAASQESQDNRIKEIPEFTYNDNEKHIIISSPKPIASKVVMKNRLEDLYCGSEIGRLLFFTRKGFITFLKR